MFLILIVVKDYKNQPLPKKKSLQNVKDCCLNQNSFSEILVCVFSVHRFFLNFHHTSLNS